MGAVTISRERVDEIIAGVRFDDRGLVPAIAQDDDSGDVLMLAWMDAAALLATVTTGRATYFSRSRQRQWIKGETSGHVQAVTDVRLDCDADTVLLRVRQTGPACHTGSATCFEGRSVLTVSTPATAGELGIHGEGTASGLSAAADRGRAL